MHGSVPLAERFPRGRWGAIVALAAGVAGVLGSYGAAGFAPGFVVAPVESALARLVPGAVVTLAITVLGDLGQRLNLAAAAALVVAAYAALTALAMVVGRELGQRWLPTLGSAGTAWALTTALTGRPILALGAAAGVGAVVALTDLSVSIEQFAGRRSGDERRRVLASLATAAGVGVLGYRAGQRRATASGVADSASGGGIYANVDVPEFDVDEQLALAAERSLDVDGIDPLVSDPFYEVDVNSVNPAVDASEWSLSITGLVDEEAQFDYADLAEMEQEHRFVTLRCVGESLNGRKIDTAVWSGVPVERVLDEVAIQSDCNCVMLRAVDGYFVQFPLDAFERGLLALGMNGDPLPRGHGAPLRALVPGHWGEVNAKWLSEIEFVAEETPGYWEERGWHGTGPVKTVAKLHARDRLDDGRIRVAGHAYAGRRGISGVEVSTDGGDAWESARLSPELPAEDAWRQWAYEYEPPGEIHEVVVRAREADGTLQPREETDPFPSGPSGWVSEEIDPREV